MEKRGDGCFVCAEFEQQGVQGFDILHSGSFKRRVVASRRNKNRQDGSRDALRREGARIRTAEIVDFRLKRNVPFRAMPFDGFDGFLAEKDRFIRHRKDRAVADKNILLFLFVSGVQTDD